MTDAGSKRSAGMLTGPDITKPVSNPPVVSAPVKIVSLSAR